MLRLATIAVVLVFAAGTVNAQRPCCGPGEAGEDSDQRCCPDQRDPGEIDDRCRCELEPRARSLPPYDSCTPSPSASDGLAPAAQTIAAPAARPSPPGWRPSTPADPGGPIFLRNRSLLL